jgi:hypothetical protein
MPQCEAREASRRARGPSRRADPPQTNAIANRAGEASKTNCGVLSLIFVVDPDPKRSLDPEGKEGGTFPSEAQERAEHESRQENAEPRVSKAAAIGATVVLVAHCEWCGVSASVCRDSDGGLRELELAAPDGMIGSCAVCGLPSVWRGGALRRVSLAEVGALRPEVARGLLAAADALRPAAA